MKVWALILKTVEEQGRCALVSVISTQGSAPRDAGANMVVTPRGYHGSIGGGTLEWHAIAAAQRVLAKGATANITSHALGPELGQCCGGQVKLLTEVFTSERLSELQSLAEAEEAGPFIVESVLGLDKVHRDLLFSPREGGREGKMRFLESFGEDHRRVYLFGAGHVGRALVLALAPLPLEVHWIDPRPDAFPGAVPRNVTPAANAELSEAPRGSLVFIMTHSHALDLAITDAALRNANIAQVGLIGSLTKRARFQKRLREAGIAPERINSLICPIGIPGIGSKAPAAIAAATAAQIIMHDEALRLATAEDKPHHVLQRTRGKW